MRITFRGYAVIYSAAFLFGFLFPWDSLPWNSIP
jgi:hypothetical protein